MRVVRYRERKAPHDRARNPGGVVFADLPQIPARQHLFQKLGSRVDVGSDQAHGVPSREQLERADLVRHLGVWNAHLQDQGLTGASRAQHVVIGEVGERSAELQLPAFLQLAQDVGQARQPHLGGSAEGAGHPAHELGRKLHLR